jgi:hypothetical protein
MRKRYTFRCPVCAKHFAYDRIGEPCCTGPSESSDDHEMTVMRLVKVDQINIPEVVGAALANGPLILETQE